MIGIEHTGDNFPSTAFSESDGQFRSGDVFFGTDAISAASFVDGGTITGPTLAQSTFQRGGGSDLSRLLLIGAIIIGGVVLWRRR
jgi:hypothetical protein